MCQLAGTGDHGRDAGYPRLRAHHEGVRRFQLSLALLFPRFALGKAAMLRLRFAFAAALLLIPLSASAELSWKRTVQEFQCTPDDKSVEAHFTFTNSGKSTVTIKEIHTTCGCTTAKLDKKVYAPGETGEVVATYSLRGQSGALRKLVTVTTDDGQQPAVLDIRVFRQEAFEVRPTLVYWRSGDAGEAKTVQLKAGAHSAHVKSVTSSNPRVTATVKTVKEGGEYAILIKPTDTAQRETAEITVTTDYPAGAPRSYKIQARVK